ncbi:MAG: homoserine O-succinyltransferase [Lachnospiraceae bacterium]|nr:homoserine O-succinyltransferase [Lachnospiraceae bacterium]
MPIKVHDNLPAKKKLEDENIFVMGENRALMQDIRPLQIAILNLMPIKEDTELQLLRSLSNTPLQVDVTFLTTATYVGTHTEPSHLDKFYETIADVKDKKFDGLIITGAPVELMEYEQVAYWDELCEIMEWSKTNVTSTMHVCWGAQAGLYYHYGIQKHLLDQKMFGIYEHKVLHRKCPLVRGYDDVFYMPHSRNTENYTEDIEKEPALKILAQSELAGVGIAIDEEASRIFVFGHPEYDRMTLDKEYRRDRLAGLDIHVPLNYYPGDDPTNRPLLRWRAHTQIYTNWLNYYVYQITPYVL